MADSPDVRPPPRSWSAPDCPAWADDDTLTFTPADARALTELGRDQARRNGPQAEPATKTRNGTMTRTRILITGSRSWDLPGDYVGRVIDGLIRQHGPILLVHGDCPTGVDRSFEAVAHAGGIPTERHPADWSRHGKAAGPRRNGEMVARGAAKCLAFTPDLAVSRGTRDCMSQAIAAGIPTWWVSGIDREPEKQDPSRWPSRKT